MTDVALRMKEDLLRLSPDDRAELAHVLWESLDGKVEEDDDVVGQDEAAWVEELNRRADDLATGRAIAEPADKVFAELREEALREKRP